MPVVLPGFTFPHRDFFVDRTWSGMASDSLDLDLAAEHISSCFRRLFSVVAVDFNTHGSTAILRPQVQQVLVCIQHQSRMGGSKLRMESPQESRSLKAIPAAPSAQGSSGFSDAENMKSTWHRQHSASRSASFACSYDDDSDALRAAWNRQMLATRSASFVLPSDDLSEKRSTGGSGTMQPAREEEEEAAADSEVFEKESVLRYTGVSL